MRAKERKRKFEGVEVKVVQRGGATSSCVKAP